MAGVNNNLIAITFEEVRDRPAIWPNWETAERHQNQNLEYINKNPIKAINRVDYYIRLYRLHSMSKNQLYSKGIVALTILPTLVVAGLVSLVGFLIPFVVVGSITPTSKV